MTLQTLDENDYYDLHNLLTRNAPWNFVIGARGLGKTFAAKRYGIKEYIKNGHEFIYLRRTDVEQRRKETFSRISKSSSRPMSFESTAKRGNCIRHHGMKRIGGHVVISLPSLRRADSSQSPIRKCISLF